MAGQRHRGPEKDMRCKSAARCAGKRRHRLVQPANGAKLDEAACSLEGGIRLGHGGTLVVRYIRGTTTNPLGMQVHDCGEGT